MADGAGRFKMTAVDQRPPIKNPIAAGLTLLGATLLLAVTADGPVAPFLMPILESPLGIHRAYEIAAADELVTQLFQTGKFTVVERSQINAILAEQDFVMGGALVNGQASDVAGAPSDGRRIRPSVGPPGVARRSITTFVMTFGKRPKPRLSSLVAS